MKFVSTRGGSPEVSIGEAIRNGAALDGGLYVPAQQVRLDPETLRHDSLAELGAQMLAPFFDGDPLAQHLPAICAEAFDFPAPLVMPDAGRSGLRLLELFHGPTGAFKDFGARFLMACFDRLGGSDAAPLTILVATSGDTGGAVGCAAEGRGGLCAVILYPRGRVSAFQQHQLCCWGAPVAALEVDGDFDDCQRLVKAAFADPALTEAHRLSSANSINIGRLLPQMVYLAAAALEIRRETGVAPGLVIPTGNLGHAVAALWARALGLPIGPIVAATNANRTLCDWHRSGVYAPHPSQATIANAMDVGAPSNFERLNMLPDPPRQLEVERVDDHAIRSRISAEYARSKHLLCPHSATAVEAWERLDPARRTERPWIAAATALPYKFADVVEPLIGETLAPPPALAEILERPTRAQRLPATLKALAEALAQQGAAAEAA
jgi:threonine synthase